MKLFLNIENSFRNFPLRIKHKNYRCNCIKCVHRHNLCQGHPIPLNEDMTHGNASLRKAKYLDYCQIGYIQQSFSIVSENSELSIIWC